jgi:hypothetical protein
VEVLRYSSFTKRRKLNVIVDSELILLNHIALSILSVHSCCGLNGAFFINV